LNDEDAYRLLEELPVDWLSMRPVSYFIEEWTDNYRRELRKYIKDMVLNVFDKNTKKLKELFGDMMPANLLKYEVDDASLDEQFDAIVSRAFQMIATNQNQQNAEQARNILTQVVQERKKMERYLSVQRHENHGSFSYRGYVLQRLHTLVNSGDLMPKFTYDGGENGWKGMEWKADSFPTDSEVLMNVTAVWLDDTLHSSKYSTGFNSRQRSFQNYHMRNLSTSDINTLKDQGFWGILNATNGQSLNRTHYKLMVEGKLWQVRSGRQNVFHTVLLLLYSMKKRKVKGIESIERIIGGRTYV